MWESSTRLTTCLAAIALAAGCATAQDGADNSSPVPYGCGQLVVIGQLENKDYELLNIEGDILGHAIIRADLHVSRFVRGGRASSKLSIQYYAHSSLREDAAFMFVLDRPEQGQVYTLSSAHLMDTHTHPSSRCEEVSKPQAEDES